MNELDRLIEELGISEVTAATLDKNIKGLANNLSQQIEDVNDILVNNILTSLMEYVGFWLERNSKNRNILNNVRVFKDIGGKLKI